MKPGRQGIILKIIEEEDIETQIQLQEALAVRGISTTQATLSRDIRDLRLVKEPVENGKTRYVKPREADDDRSHNGRLRKILRESVLALDIAQNILVVKTLSGLASGACSAIDGMQFEGVVGSLAGDDTIFLAMKDASVAKELLHTLEGMIR